MRFICLVALIGLPGAGKSSLCTWLLGQQAALRVCHIVHLCYDDFLDVRPSAQLLYKEQRKLIFKVIEQLITAIQEDNDWPPQVRRTTSSGDRSSRGHLILCDDNFYYRSMRNKLHQLCRNAGCVFGQIYISSPLKSCLQANSTRSTSSRVPEGVVRQMNERLEPPGSEAWESNSITLDDLDAAGPALLAFISSLLDMPAKKASSPPNRQPQDQSLAHSLDLLLRTRIGALLQGLTQEDKCLAGRTLNNKRKEILTQFRREGGGKALDYYVNLLN
ncbi:L-seryl-tRNA(Sec) kinase [Drosophila rhopaloa]|uniref:L-seryl-tRNA(Sec) kinase n=1 Tax=Drosophila rhopaloa TaxID=1041015 RepID=A0A6P4EG42_DRORH|nr:L-seryl-tRNA(Sec) kinase [Drosophila rhopaloa]